MTKSLTEQWREGTLEFGFYYVSFPNEEPQIYSSEYLKNYVNVKDGDNIEVLAPVPSYDENKKLKEQLEIAKIVLGQIAMFSSDKADAVQCAKAIKEINEVE